MKPRHKRFAMIGIAGVALAIAATLVLNAFQKNLVFFFSPTQVVAKEAPQGRSFRVGGLVEVGSVKRQPDGVTVNFIVTDTAHSIPVSYRGVLPDLFKEGKGVVTQGKLDASGVFVASEVLAKHDENYMPPEAADAVKKAHAKGSAPAEDMAKSAPGNNEARSAPGNNEARSAPGKAAQADLPGQRTLVTR